MKVVCLVVAAVVRCCDIDGGCGVTVITGGNVISSTNSMMTTDDYVPNAFLFNVAVQYRAISVMFPMVRQLAIRC